MSNAEANEQSHNEEMMALREEHSRELRAQAAASHLAGVQQTKALLRKSLWLCHGCPPAALYGDDGEMQCHTRGCCHDFKRSSIDQILALLGQREIDQQAQKALLIAENATLRSESDYRDSQNAQLETEIAGLQAKIADLETENTALKLTNANFKTLLEPTHGADWGGKNRHTLGDIVEELMAADTQDEFCDAIDKALLFGAWGFMFTAEDRCNHKIYTPQFARNVRGLLLALMNAAYDRAAEIASDVRNGLQDAMVDAAVADQQEAQRKVYASGTADSIHEHILKLKVTK